MRPEYPERLYYHILETDIQTEFWDSESSVNTSLRDSFHGLELRLAGLPKIFIHDSKSSVDTMQRDSRK